MSLPAAARPLIALFVLLGALGLLGLTLRPAAKGSGLLPESWRKSDAQQADEALAGLRLPDFTPDHEKPSREDDELLSYRKHLEAHTSPSGYVHSSTLTFDRIYVVSLPFRHDRRETMSRIANALGLKFTFVDAVSKDAPLIAWIGERVYETRQRKKPGLVKALGLPPNEIGGMGINSIWLARPGARGAAATLDLPSLADPRWDGKDWLAYMNELEARHPDSIETLLRPDDPAFNLTDKLWDPLETIASRQIVPAVLATWHSHVRAMRLMQTNKDESALILEDDVDIEWNVERMWAAIHRRMPLEWELAFLGHCWGREMTYPSKVHPALFSSFGPRCLHGYALSSRGYSHLLQLLDEPWSAYQAPVDTAVPTLIRTGDITPYSVDPPLIIQAKNSASDIQPGTGSLWRGLMADSTLDRIWRDEEKEVPDLTWDEAVKDPGVVRPHVNGQQKRRQRRWWQKWT